MPPRAPNRLVLVLCATAAVSVSGCGGGDSSTTSSSSGSDFASQANEICVGVSTQSAALASPTDELSSIAAYTKSTLAIIKPAVTEMHALTPPEGQKSEFHAYLTALDEEIQLEKGLYYAANSGDAPGVNALLKDIKATGAVQKAAALGLTECAKGV